MPVFQISPGINITEKDLTTVIPAVSTTSAGIAGAFVWGPVEERTLVTTENELVSLFGKPDADTAKYFFPAANFLGYGNNLSVVRVVGSLASNAVVFQSIGTDGEVEPAESSSSSSMSESSSSSSSSSTDDITLIKNETDYLSQTLTGKVMVAKYPGSLGNGLHVSICDTAAAFATWTSTIGGTSYDQAAQFTSAPGTSDYATNRSGSGDEMHIIVRDADGRWTGVKGTVLEKFQFVSKASDAKKDDGTSNYYKNVLNNESQYLWWASHPTGGTYWGNTAASTAFATVGSIDFNFHLGVDANSPSDANLEAGYDLFADAETVDCSLLISGPASATVQAYLIDNIAVSRLDCLVFVSPLQTDAVNNSGSETADTLVTRNALTSTSYGVMDTGWKYQYDRYNDTYRWIPCNGDTAGLCARTDDTNDPWFSPAGVNRGKIKNVTKLAWSPNKAERDSLYKAGVNPIITMPGQGTVLWGDKTMLNKPSAFGQIGVRRLFIVLEKAIATYAKYSLFEFNDEFSRSQFKAQVEPYLRNIQARRGISDFLVVCDTTNNTSAVISARNFVGDVYIKPNYSTNFVQLNFVATSENVNFQEITS